MTLSIGLALLVLCVGISSGAVAQTKTIGQTTVATWKDGKKAAFLLAFDDSCVSHLQNAIPELEKRNLVGTFYINAGSGQYKGQEAAWKKAAASPSVALGNHTFKHVGATTPEQLDEELARENEAICALYPDRKPPYLLSFAQPGGVPWTVEKSEVERLFAKHRLVSRPPFHGPPFTHKTIEEALKLVDGTIQSGGVGHLDFHGVGGDWHVVSMEYYTALLDRLAELRNELWTTDHLTSHKYEQERKTANAAGVVADGRVQVRLTCEADPGLYDLPLTLQTVVPADWKVCRITQGQRTSEAVVTNGKVQYEAVPNGAEIVLFRAN